MALMVQKAVVLGLAGRLAESRDALHRFLAIAPTEPTDQRLQAGVLAAILDELLGDAGTARGLLLEELSRVPERATGQRADLQRELAFASYFQADWEQTAYWARESLNSDAEGMCAVGAQSALALAEYALADLVSARQSAAMAAQLFDCLQDHHVAGYHPGIGAWLGWAEVSIERCQDAVRHLERAVAIAQAAGQRHVAVPLLAVQCLSLTSLGELLEASRVSEAATEAGLLSGSDLFLSWAMSLRCSVETQVGNPYDAVRFGERGATAALGAGPLASIAQTVLAQALLELGEAERCRSILCNADGEIDLPPFPLHDSLNYELLTRAELMLGDAARAAECAAEAACVANQVGLHLPAAYAQRAQALVELDAGAAAGAAALALAAAESSELANCPVEAARSRTLAGRAFAAAGQRDQAIAELQQAYSRLQALGALRYADSAARELRKLGRVVRFGHSSRSDPSTGLTKREIEVLEGVARGRTNRQIADELFLSVRTVDRHVSRILAKLGVASRAAAVSQFERMRADSAEPVMNLAGGDASASAYEWHGGA
jgi:DNA-binding NarL/FixJ family response regulator